MFSILTACKPPAIKDTTVYPPPPWYQIAYPSLSHITIACEVAYEMHDTIKSVVIGHYGMDTQCTIDGYWEPAIEGIKCVCKYSTVVVREIKIGSF